MRAIDVYYARVERRAIVEFADKRARPYLRSTIECGGAPRRAPRAAQDHHAHRGQASDRRPPARSSTPRSHARLAQRRCRGIARASRRIGASCSIAIGSSTRRSRSWASAASASGPIVVLLEGGRRRRPAVPPGQGGRGLGVRAVPRTQPVRVARRAGRHRPATAPGDQRHPARLDDRRTGPPPVRPPAPGREGVRRRRGDDPDDLTTWGELAAWALARGHATPATRRSSPGTSGDDEFAHAVGGFATTYADQTDHDFETFLGAIKTGRIAAQPGV